MYFQPPASVRMSYPAIVYSINDVNDLDANNNPYVHNKSYSVTLIDKDPDSIFFDRLLDFQYCEFVRAYQSDNLNHFVFKIFY